MMHIKILCWLFEDNKEINFKRTYKKNIYIIITKNYLLKKILNIC